MTKVLPENHLWGPRDYFKSDYYREAPALFASEMGYHGCPQFSDAVVDYYFTKKLAFSYIKRSQNPLCFYDG